MTVIFVRSPYKILVDEPTQVYTKCLITITSPAGGTPKVVTLEKQIPDVTNIDCWFNISPYIKDEIENIATGTATATDEESDMWRLVNVITYYKVNLTDDWTEHDEYDFVAVNGYNNYIGGHNQSYTNDVVYLTNPSVKIKRSDNSQHFNILVDFDNAGGYDLVYKYRDLSGTTIEDVVVLDNTNDSKVYMLKVPYRTSDPDLADGSSVQVRLNTSGGVIQQEKVYFINEDECLYTPIKCTFINSFGGWQYLTFFKARTDSYDVKSKGFNLLSDAVDYNPLRGQKKEFNFDMTQTVKANTGWVDENTIELLVELLASETILLDNEPVTLKDKSIQKKTRLRDKMINYELNFEYAFNLINDVD
jgi:hypothetical protein